MLLRQLLCPLGTAAVGPGAYCGPSSCKASNLAVILIYLTPYSVSSNNFSPIEFLGTLGFFFVIATG